eukprot:TRINITY_DN15313_c0_g1_i1.p2 TRINITY_DN15313_c0_g1~~TRINITY_DN15313_c0_g1_i1.p2  ORF type:complete len:403 (-),score=88.12 TRINITY_DN15313_c0_g1_i1:275-1483(-)
MSAVQLGLSLREWITNIPIIIIVVLYGVALLGGVFQGCCVCFPQWMNCCMSFWGCAMWFWLMLFFALYFALSIAVGDVCTTFIPYIWQQSFLASLPQAQALAQCTNQTLFDIFGVGDQFDFSSSLNIGSLNSLGTITQSLNMSTYIPSVQLLVNSRANFTRIMVGRDMPSLIAAVNASIYDSANANIASSLRNAYQLIAPSVQLAFSLTNQSAYMNGEAVVNAMNTVSPTLDPIIVNITNVFNELTNFQTYFQQLKAATSCAFIGTAYSNLILAVCTQMGGGFTVVWFGLLLLACAMLPGCILGQVGATRYGLNQEEARKRNISSGIMVGKQDKGGDFEMGVVRTQSVQPYDVNPPGYSGTPRQSFPNVAQPMQPMHQVDPYAQAPMGSDYGKPIQTTSYYQ